MEYFIMAFDDSDINEISKNFDLTQVALKLNILENGTKNNWDGFLAIIDNIPQCFGMIALQILCASRMERTDNYTESTYNLILENYINQNNIQPNYKKYQDKMWQLVKCYIEKDLNFKTSIPNSRIGKGRYIQYPLSQVYLNKNDLLYLRGLFKHNQLKPNQAVRFEDLNNILEITQGFKNIDKKYRTSHFDKVVSREMFQLLIAQQQIHNEFLNWDGELFKKSKRELALNKKLHCENLEETPFIFYYYEQQETHDVNKLNFKKELLQNNIISKSTDYLVLRIPEGKYDFEDVRKVKIDEEVIILVFNFDCPITVNLANINIQSIDIGLNGCELYKFKINSVIAESALGEKIVSHSRNNLLELKNGYRLLNNKFLKNHGPKYLIKEDLRITINQSSNELKCGEELDLGHFDIGNYLISISKAHNFTIEISENQINDFIEKSDKGWKLDKYKPYQPTFDMFGLLTDELFVDNSTRSFIDVIVKQNKIKTNNQILKTLSRLN